MKQLYNIVTEDWKMMGTDKSMSVDLSFLDPTTDCTMTYAQHATAEGKRILTRVDVQCTANASQLHTTVIQGNKRCVRISGTIVGSAEHAVLDKQYAALLADPDIQWASIDAYTGKGTIVDLQADWVSNDSSGTVMLKAWFTDAGQSTARAC